MSNITIPNQFGAVSTVFANANVNNDLAAGVVSGFGIISYRGKVWRTKYRGEERDLMRADGDGPRSSIEVVILKASGNLAKIFYESGYVEGSTAQPDCWSSNGVTPDANAPNKQHSACATCKQNAFGSRITPAGKQGKACSDSKRLAIVPLEDIDNEVFGGPLLHRLAIWRRSAPRCRRWATPTTRLACASPSTPRRRIRSSCSARSVR